MIGSVQVTTLQLTFLPILYTAAKSRKSNCVKEVERLKKNRDERRAKQAEQALQRNEGYDASTPQWEFFQKIRSSVTAVFDASLHAMTF